MLDFPLDPRLEADTLGLCKMELCQVRVMNDNRFSWLVLIPEIKAACEMMDLSPPVQTQLFHEIMRASEVLKQVTCCDKINIAAFGNMVSQLHVHVIARFETDPAWPGSAIGFDGKLPFKNNELPKLFEVIHQSLSVQVD